MKNLLLSTFIIISLFTQAQLIEWEWTYEPTTESSSRAQNIYSNSSEYIYVTGYYSDSIIFTFDTTYVITDTVIIGVDTTYYTSDTTIILTEVETAVGLGLYVAKFDTLGNFYWAKNIRKSSTPEICADYNNNVYITGKTNDSVFFENDTLIGIKSYVAKIDENGNYVWKQGIYSTGYIKPMSINADTNNFIYIAGNFEKNLDIDTVSIDTVDAYYPMRLFILKLNSDGACLKYNSALLDTEGMYDITSMSTSQTGSCYISGTSNIQNVDFGNGILSNNPGFMEYPFIVKYNSNLDAQWVKEFSFAVGFGQSGNVDVTDNYLYSTGMFVGDINIDTFSVTSNVDNSAEVYVVKIDTLGATQWLKSFGSSSDGGEQGFSITSNHNQESFFISMFSDTIVLGIDTLISEGVPSNFVGDDIFIAKLDSAGEVIWGNRIGLAGDFNFGEIDCTEGGTLLIAGFSLDNAKSTNIENSFIGMRNDHPITTNIETTILKKDKLIIYPNPTNNIIYVNYSSNINKIDIYSIDGKLVDSYSNINSKSYTINFHSKLNGIYFIRVYSKNASSVSKIIKH